MGESAEGQRGPGRLDILQGGSLKGTVAGCPYVPQDELLGKTISLAEQGALAGSKRRRVYHLWKKGQETQEECRGLVTESQNHRMVGVGRELCGSSSPTLLPKQGHLQQAAQDLVCC